MERYEVIVVGGGPAGANAGRAAAEHDADVLVLEKGIPRSDRDELGPDSTDAAGMLNYWLDIMGLDIEEIPEHIILQELDGVDFFSPNEQIALETTGISATYPKFGFTFHRARMDDWMRERAEAAGAQYRVGDSVRTVDLSHSRSSDHIIELANGESIAANALILADGPQRRVTLQVLEEVLPAEHPALDAMSPTVANHIAYQEYRRFPKEEFDPARLKFWWGWMPGETAYPWVFPNEDPVCRVGFTRPLSISLEETEHAMDYPLIEPTDTKIPDGQTYINRLLRRLYGDQYDVASEFPIVSDRGKRDGTETYTISSTRPIDSPVGVNVAITGGAMGTTSAFHEGGYHLATKTGSIAGKLAATDSLQAYNSAWKDAVGSEILRNVVFADLVDGYGPSDWDRVFRTARRMKRDAGDTELVGRTWSAGVGAIGLYLGYHLRKRRYRNGRYVQLSEDEYVSH